MVNSFKPQDVDQISKKTQYMDGHADALMHAIDAFIRFQLESKKLKPELRIKHFLKFREYIVDLFCGIHGEKYAIYAKMIKTTEYGPWNEEFLELLKDCV